MSERVDHPEGNWQLGSSTELAPLAVDEFFHNTKTIAVVGASRSGTGFGNRAVKELRRRGFEVFAVNHHARSNDSAVNDEVSNNHTRYASLAALPQRPDLVVVSVSPEHGQAVLRECAELALDHVFLQQGAQSDELLHTARDLRLTCVHGRCVLMYLGPAAPICRFHGGLAKLFGGYDLAR